MKNIIISADGPKMVYSVPDIVADHLEKYCLEFCTTWLVTSPDAKKYRVGGALCYNEEDFIEYLNQWVFPTEKSSLVEKVSLPLPEQYKNCPEFHF